MDKIDFLRDEVRCGFYVPTAIKQAWATQLNILSEIDLICRKYNLTYFAEWGTLLGTVRHGGFIPWDDDIDISMMREDYNKFLEVAKEELPEDFAIHNFKTKDNHWLFLARVINKNQICFDKAHLDKNYNFPYIATVDIFVLDYLYVDEKKERERCDEVKRIIALADNIVAGKMDKESIEYYCRELENKYSTKIVRGLSNYDLGVCLYELAEKQMARTKYEESDKIGQIFPWILKGRSGLPKEYYESTIRLPFEYTTMPVAANYHKVLSARYGNYMEIHKIWGGHDYPYFEGQKKNLQAVADFKLPEFEYDEKMLRQDTDGAEFYPVGSYKETVFQCKNIIVNYGKNFNSFISEKRFGEVLNTAVECQQIAIELGEYIEQLKGETNTSVVKVVGCLERLCNDLVSFYDSIASYVELNDETETESIEELLAVINKDITDIDAVIAKEILDKKQVLFVANDARYWNAFEPYYLASCKECEVQVVHVPLLYKDAYGELMMSDEDVEKAVSAEAYDKRFSVTSWDMLDLQLMSFDIIYIQCPYDAENPCFTTPQNYYAKELLKHCKELVYVPVFDVDEFTEKDITTVYNTKHYVTMPGVVCADKTVVQSDTMRDVYINIMTNFAGESTRTIWENKIVCRSKYMQDIGGVLSCNVNENDAEKNKASKKKLLYCIGASDLYEYQDVAELIDNKLKVMIDNSSNVEVEVLFYPPNLDENESITKIKQEIVDKINNKKYNVISKYEEVSVDDFDAYYGCRSPMCLEFTRRNKPVMVSDYYV